MKGIFLIYFVVAALMLVLVGGWISGVSLNDKNNTPAITDIIPDEAVTEEVPPKKDITHGRHKDKDKVVACLKWVCSTTRTFSSKSLCCETY